MLFSLPRKPDILRPGAPQNSIDGSSASRPALTGALAKCIQCFPQHPCTCCGSICHNVLLLSPDCQLDAIEAGNDNKAHPSLEDHQNA